MLNDPFLEWFVLEHIKGSFSQKQKKKSILETLSNSDQNRIKFSSLREGIILTEKKKEKN